VWQIYFSGETSDDSKEKVDMVESEWERICGVTVSEMIGHVKKYITPISRVLSDKEGELLGSGAYFETNQSKYVITNEHVAKHRNKSSLAHQFFGNEKIIIILTNPAYAELAPVDVAISRINQNRWNICEHSALAISIERFAVKHAPVSNELLFFAGYSGERSKFLFGHLFTQGTPYLTQECEFPTSVKEGNSKYHFALHYPPDLAQAKQILQFIDQMKTKNRMTFIHCHAGVGRTGTMLHAYFLGQGLTLEEAKAQVKKHRIQCTLLSDEQKAFLKEFANEQT